MSLVSCEKCWNTICTCGHEYKDYGVAAFSVFIAEILAYKTPEERQEILKMAAEATKRVPYRTDE